MQRRTFRDQDPVNIEASELIARLHDALKASGYDGHDLELFLVRTVFCLFADDTGIFEPRDIFLDFIGRPGRGRPAEVPGQARLAAALRPGLRLRQHQAFRARGHGHVRVLRPVADRLLNVVRP